MIIILKKIIDLKLIDFKVGCLFFLSPVFCIPSSYYWLFRACCLFLFFSVFFIRIIYLHILSKIIIVSIIPFIHEGLLLMITPLIIFDTYLFLKIKKNLILKK